MNKREFDIRFSTEKQCRKYLFELRKKMGLSCECNSTKFWFTEEGKYICPLCKTRHSIREGTIFQKSRLSLMSWFRGLYYISSASQSGNISLKELQLELGAGSKHTAISVMNKIKQVMYSDNPQKLRGDVAVVLDPGKSIYNDMSFLVGIEILNGKTGCIMCSFINKKSPDDQLAFIEKYTEVKTRIYCDGDLKGFERLSEKGYISINKVPAFVNRKAIRLSEDIGKTVYSMRQMNASTNEILEKIRKYCAVENTLKRPVTFEKLIQNVVIEQQKPEKQKEVE